MKSSKKITPFLLLNILIAIAFLISSYGGHIAYWPLELFVLGSFYLLLLLLTFLLFWLIIRKSYSLISLIAIILSLPVIGNVYQVPYGKKFTIERKQNAFRVMSWNVDRFDVMSDNKNSPIRKKMFDLIVEYRPDIACFPEMVSSKSKPDAMNYLPDMLGQMNMRGYYHVFDDDEYYINNQEFGKIIISKYPILYSKIIAFADRSYNNRFLYADVLIGADTVRVFVVHLQSLKFSKDEVKVTNAPGEQIAKTIDNSSGVVSKIRNGFNQRVSQADTLYSYISQSPYPVIVCGDFNDVPNSYAYNKIGTGLKDAFVEKGKGLGTSFSGISPTLRIDHIFVSKKYEVLQFVTEPISLSDHYPLVADIGLK